MNRRLIALGCLLLLAAGGCVSRTAGTRGAGENLGQQVARHEQQLQSLLSQVGQVEQVLPGQAEMWAQMQTMRQDLNQLQGRLEEAHMQTAGGGSGEFAMLREKVRRMEVLLRQIASQLAIDTRSLDMTDYTAPPAPTGGYGAGAQPAGAPVAPPLAGATPSVAQPAETGDMATRLYDAGIRNFDQRKYKEAVASFKDFVAAYPQHSLTSNAWFWQGESYFQMKDYARAALAYQEVITKFPGSGKMQSAMLKQGISLYNAGKKDASKERLDELVKRYPSSPEATRAKQFLSANK